MTNVAQSNSWLSNTSCNLMKDQLNPLNRHLNGWTSYPNTYLGSRPCISLIKHYNYNDWFFAPCTGLYTFCKCSKYVNAVPWLGFGNRDIRNLALWSVHGNCMSLWDSSPVPPSVPNTSCQENTVCHFKLTKHAEEWILESLLCCFINWRRKSSFSGNWWDICLETNIYKRY